MQIESLKWDSDFLGIEVGKLTLTKDNKWNEDDLKRYDLVYIFVDPSDDRHNSLLKEKGILLADQKITYLMKIEKETSASPDPGIQSYSSSTKDDDVISLGIQSSVYSRFNVDSKFDKNKFKELYEIWMKRSISREIAKDVLVYKQKNEIAGVVTIGEKNSRADIGLIAVDGHYRGQNIGKKLVQGAVNYAHVHQYNFLQVVTQKLNEGACRFYEQCGFKEESTINIYHFWNIE